MTTNQQIRCGRRWDALSCPNPANVPLLFHRPPRRPHANRATPSLPLYLLRGCELDQYRRGIESSDECTDSELKHRYNIYNIVGVSIKEKTPYILRLDFDSPYSEEVVPLLLKFNDVGRRRGADHLKFTAWFRMLTATMSLPDRDVALRPMPSNVCFALYFVLQKLYRHKELFSTERLFGRRPPKSMNAEVMLLADSLCTVLHEHADTLLSKSHRRGCWLENYFMFQHVVSLHVACNFAASLVEKLCVA